MVIILAIVFIAFMYNRVRYNKSTVPTFILSILLWVVILFFAFTPRISDPLAGYFGFGRGLDLLLVVAVFISLYAVFRLYVHIEDINSQLTDLTRELALANEIIAEQKEQLDKSSHENNHEE